MPDQKQNKKIFVLDTSVILHDHESVNHFDGHDIAIPITVLEELDHFKKGNETKNFELKAYFRRKPKKGTSCTGPRTASTVRIIR